jgi:hypothetical protein
MITIEITTNDGESWTEPYHGSADQARSELVGSVVEFEPHLITIVKVERVDRALT